LGGGLMFAFHSPTMAVAVVGCEIREN
jgi:hypothetical protein